MKLEKILEHLNSFEKNSFLKIIDSILASKPHNAIEVDKILTEKTRDLKNMDNINIVKVFNLVQGEFGAYVKTLQTNVESQFDVLIDVISRDGNCIMKQDWFARLYEKELENFERKLKEFQNNINDEKHDMDEQRRRDYKTYRACVHTAYFNDEENNLEKKITSDEQSILTTLSGQLGLSQEEIKLLNYLVLPVKKTPIDEVINELKGTGVVFYSKKTNTIYIADEIVKILRRTRGKEIGDKFFRRVLKLLREPQINLVCKRHNIDWRLPLEQKIKSIITEGISFSGVLGDEIYKPGTLVSEKKQFLNDFYEKDLKIAAHLKGGTIEEKIASLTKYFDDIEQDEKVGISIDGYEKLLLDLNGSMPEMNSIVRNEFQFQADNVLKSEFLLEYNIKPRDVLELIPAETLESFATTREIKSRGDIILNILDSYKDAENLYLENYENIGFRNLAALKENGIEIREIDLGNKFEEITKTIFMRLGFNVDDVLKKTLNTDKDKIDIILNLGNNDVILVECKTSKESGYNKFSSVSRQLKAYSTLLKLNNHKVVKSLLVAPEFSEDFVKDCSLDYELNLSLITSGSLMRIATGFKNSKHKHFPHNLLMRDVLIQEERILAAIEK
jgi:hypothetical protein